MQKLSGRWETIVQHRLYQNDILPVGEKYGIDGIDSLSLAKPTKMLCLKGEDV
jgi:hypothetical protein